MTTSITSGCILVTPIVCLFDDYNIHLIGHSMGGAVAVLMYDIIPDRILSFINIEGNLVGDDCRFVSRNAIKSSNIEYIEEFFANLKAQYKVDPKGYYALDGTNANVFYKSSKSLVEWSDNNHILLKKFLDMKCSKLYVCGSQNSKSEVLNYLDNTKKLMIENTGHFSMIDFPDVFYNYLENFIKYLK